MKKTALLCICLVFTVYGMTQNIQNSPANLNDSIINNPAEVYMKDTSRVGLSIGVYKDDQTFTSNYGFKDKHSKTKPANETIYEIGSITKTFTGTLLAQAVIDKKVNIDDDVRKYLSGSYPNLEYNGQSIKLFQLINHTSGIPFFLPDKPEIFESPNYDTLPFTICNIQQNYSRQNFFDDLHKVKLDTVPGFNFKYSNAGAQLLQFILEKTYKMSYEQLLEKYISARLGMKQTSSTCPKNDLSNLAKGYNNKGIVMPYNPKQFEAAGGIYSSVSDMLKYIKFHLNEKDAVIKLSHTPTLGDINDFAIGLNWQMNSTKDGFRRIWQSGGTFGFSSYCVIYPELNIGIVLLTNEADQTAQGGLEEVAAKIFEGLNGK